ncbi:hypothetical protein D0T87_10285 [Bacteroides sp. 51]|nr:hypothetical protein [Bacteroides sp. 51]
MDTAHSSERGSIHLKPERMNPSITTYIRMAVLLTGICLLASCIREDLDGCPPRTSSLRVYFAYNFDYVTRNITGDDIKDVHLYVFDEQERFVLDKWDYGVTLDNNYYMELALEPGSYQFVAWFNEGDSYQINPLTDTFVPGETLLAEAQLYLACSSDNQVRTALPHLFFGNLHQAVVIPNEENKFTIPVKQDTYRINLTVEGLTPDANTYASVITDNNGRYHFDNSFAPCQELHYIQQTNFKGNSLATSTVVLRLADGRNPILKLLNETENRSLFAGNLMAMIREANKQGAEIDFDTTHVFNILLTFGTDMEVTITINGWSFHPSESILY